MQTSTVGRNDNMMDKVITHMVDTKAAIGTALTMASSLGSWLDIAEPIVTITMTLVVGGATLWYTIERAAILRKARKENK